MTVENTTTKVCFKCGTEKARSAFYSHPMMADGLLGKCKDCTKRDTRNNYRQRRDYYRDYDRKRDAKPSRRAARLNHQREMRARYPEKYKARAAVQIAVASGKLQPQPCEMCSATKVEAHHDDYSKPLAIRWLCFKHHRAIHGQAPR